MHLSLSEIVTLVGELAAIISAVSVFFAALSKVNNGTKCLLRSEMLRIYYRHRESGQIRQYELENFIYLYEAYKKLGGNSFIDRIYDEVTKWKVVT